MPPQERELIFERFRRGSSTGGEEGFGLGLAIGRELAERLGGRLDLADDRRAPGARFVLSLPIELPAGSHPREPEHGRLARLPRRARVRSGASSRSIFRVHVAVAAHVAHRGRRRASRSRIDDA